MDIRIEAVTARSSPDWPRDPYLRSVLAQSGHHWLPHRGDTRALYDRTGRRIGVELQRDPAATATTDPLFLECLADDWQLNSAPQQDVARHLMTQCEVRYLHRGLVNIRYRFHREVFDYPDIPGLDRRVQALVQQMLDGAER